MQPGSERAVHSDAVYNNDIQRGDSVQMTTRSKTWLSGARCLICGGGGSGLEVVEWLEKFCNLSACPRPWARAAHLHC